MSMNNWVNWVILGCGVIILLTSSLGKLVLVYNSSH
jgi:hypothetical protein